MTDELFSRSYRGLLLVCWYVQYQVVAVTVSYPSSCSVGLEEAQARKNKRMCLAVVACFQVEYTVSYCISLRAAVGFEEYEYTPG